MLDYGRESWESWERIKKVKCAHVSCVVPAICCVALRTVWRDQIAIYGINIHINLQFNEEKWSKSNWNEKEARTQKNPDERCNANALGWVGRLRKPIYFEINAIARKI